MLSKDKVLETLAQNVKILVLAAEPIIDAKLAEYTGMGMVNVPYSDLGWDVLSAELKAALPMALGQIAQKYGDEGHWTVSPKNDQRSGNWLQFM